MAAIIDSFQAFRTRPNPILRNAALTSVGIRNDAADAMQITQAIPPQSSRWYGPLNVASIFQPITAKAAAGTRAIQMRYNNLPPHLNAKATPASRVQLRAASPSPRISVPAPLLS